LLERDQELCDSKLIYTFLAGGISLAFVQLSPIYLLCQSEGNGRPLFKFLLNSFCLTSAFMQATGEKTKALGRVVYWGRQ